MTYTILHAEDEPMNSTLVKRFAENAQKEAGQPIDVFSARDGLEAVALYEQLRAKGTQVNLLITDFDMPAANGEYLVSAIRQRVHIPIVLFCSTAQERAQKMGTEYVEKGMNASELKQVITKHASTKPRVLIVEDDNDSRELFGLDFAQAGYFSVMAPNAEGALPNISSVHVVLSDVYQPESIGGYGLLKEARKRYTREQLPFFLTSTDQIDAEQCIEHAAYPMQKPFEFAKLEMLIRNTLPQHLKPNKAV